MKRSIRQIKEGKPYTFKMPQLIMKRGQTFTSATYGVTGMGFILLPETIKKNYSDKIYEAMVSKY